MGLESEKVMRDCGLENFRCLRDANEARLVEVEYMGRVSGAEGRIRAEEDLVWGRALFLWNKVLFSVLSSRR